MGAPQIVWVILATAGVVLAMVKHGEPRDPFNAWITLIATGLSGALLYWGGFFGA